MQHAYNLVADTHTPVAILYKDPLTKIVHIGGVGDCLNYISIPENMETKWVPPVHPQSYLLSYDVCKRLPLNSPVKPQKKSNNPKSKKPVFRIDPNFAQKSIRLTPEEMNSSSSDQASKPPPASDQASDQASQPPPASDQACQPPPASDQASFQIIEPHPPAVENGPHISDLSPNHPHPSTSAASLSKDAEPNEAQEMNL